jgi:uncharacterized cupin superfamily protein
MRKTVKHSKAVWSTTPTTFKKMYKPGETMSCVIGDGVPTQITQEGERNH